MVSSTSPPVPSDGSKRTFHSCLLNEIQVTIKLPNTWSRKNTSILRDFFWRIYLHENHFNHNFCQLLEALKYLFSTQHRFHLVQFDITIQYAYAARTITKNESCRELDWSRNFLLQVMDQRKRCFSHKQKLIFWECIFLRVNTRVATWENKWESFAGRKR